MEERRQSSRILVMTLQNPKSKVLGMLPPIRPLPDSIKHDNQIHVTVGSGCLENGWQPLNAFVDNAFFRANSSLHNTVGGASAAKVSGIRESSDFADGVKFASNLRFHPHSLREYHGSLANGSPYSFSSTISNMASNTGIATIEASDGRHIHRMGSTRNVAEFNAGGE